MVHDNECWESTSYFNFFPCVNNTLLLILENIIDENIINM